MSGNMRLLFITQKLHQQDVFALLWVRAFQRLGYDVTVLCLENRTDLTAQTLGVDNLPLPTIVSMGKERGSDKVVQVLIFWKAIRTLQYDRVFIHMSPVWGLLGAPVWILRRTPVYLWYTHYKMQAGLRLLGWYGKRLFCATAQSLPQYERSPKKIVTGHGIDLQYWPQRDNQTKDPHALLGVYRLSRSKRIELPIKAMLQLPEYHCDIYGIEAEPDYVNELKALVTELQLSDRVRFHPSVAAKDLPALYASHRLILNMASETIDKTMLEAMTCGCYPVTTARNAAAIPLPAAPNADTPEAIAAFVRQYAQQAPMSDLEMYDTVAKHHSLESIVSKMDQYIRSGT